MKKKLLTLILIAILYGCVSSQINPEEETRTCISISIPDAYKLFQTLDEYLIENKYLKEGEKNSYLELIKKIQNKEVEIKGEEIFKNGEERMTLSSPSNFVSMVGCFNEIKEKNSNLSKEGFILFSQNIENMAANNSLGPPYDEKLIHDLKDESFSVDIYKNVILYLIWFNINNK